MNRALILLTGASGVSSLLLIDSAIKGAVLLLFAAGVVFLLRRDSAATRHLVWLVAIVAMLAVPLFSALLPEWRVLPEWAAVANVQDARQISDVQYPELETLDLHTAAVAQTDEPSAEAEDKPTSLPALNQDPSPTPNKNATASTPLMAVASTGENQPVAGDWKTVAFAMWLIGFSLLSLRLIAARLLLWQIERVAVDASAGAPQRQQKMEASSDSVPENSSTEKINAAFTAAHKTLNIRQSVKLLVHPDKTVPVVWGILRPRLLLPVSAMDWSEQQLQSVLLHELAHIKRRDTLGQLLAQFACALHWFNPLVWFASWRLHVERERACDDLVLASGVRASAYAEHLLDVATKLTTTRWTQTCGLAMARNSSLHGRLSAVLSKKQNRRSVTTALLITSVVLSVGIAIPLAMLHAADEPTAESSANSVPEGNLDGAPKADEQKPEEDLNASTTPATLPPNLEAMLEWGEPCNGLRGAVMIQTAVQKPELANRPKVFLVLQNVSDKTIRFCDTQMKKNDDVRIKEDKRTLYLRDTKGILSGLSSSGGTGIDAQLQPREVVMIDQFYGEQTNKKGLATSVAIVDVIIHNPSLSYSALLNLVTAPEGTWTGKLTTPSSRGALSANGALPKNEETQPFFKHCLDQARLNGDIPGGTINLLRNKVLYFIEINKGDQYGDAYAKKMQPIVARFDNTGDWSQADAATLFDDVAAITTIPFKTTMDAIRNSRLQRGKPLPKLLKNANWGDSLTGGLRMAWTLDPAADQYHLGTTLKSRVVIHNSGDEPVAFVTRSFHQPGHSAKNTTGSTIPLESTFWTTIGRPEPYRLHPGEYCEVYAPGVGIGPRASLGNDWANVRPGTQILANEGDEVVFQSGDVWLTGDHNQTVDSDWWLKFVSERLNREAPLPNSRRERKLILFRAVKDLFGTAPRTTEADSFYADKSPEALKNLAVLLSKRSWITAVTGAIKSGPTKFKVLPIDPGAATRARIASNPGRYNLGDDLRLVVSRRTNGRGTINEANLTWYPKGNESAATPVSLPSGYNTWAAGWMPETTLLWVATKDWLRSYDFSNPESIQTHQFDGEEQASASITDELRTQLTKIIATGERPKGPVPPAAASVPDSNED